MSENEQLPTGITYTQRLVKPLDAISYLDTQVPNRNLTWTTVTRYARDMAEGAWQDNGEVIKLNPDGQMIDGQHRMQAIVVAEDLCKLAGRDFEGVWLRFALNVPDETRQSMDIGRKRRLADEMAFEGSREPSRTAAVVFGHLAYSKGNYTNASGTGFYKPTQAEALAHWRANRDIFQTTLLRALDTTRQGLGTAAATGVAYHVLRTTYGDDLTERFWGPLVSGANLIERSPILALRNKLVRYRELKLDRREVLAYIFRAWNLWIDDKQVDTLYFKAEINNKNFPLPRDPNAKRTPSSVLKEEE